MFTLKFNGAAYIDYRQAGILVASHEQRRCIKLFNHFGSHNFVSLQVDLWYDQPVYPLGLFRAILRRHDKRNLLI